MKTYIQRLRRFYSYNERILLKSGITGGNPGDVNQADQSIEAILCIVSELTNPIARETFLPTILTFIVLPAGLNVNCRVS